MTDFKQRRLHLTKTFTLNEKGLLIIETNFFNKAEFFINYEEINFEKKTFERKFSWLVLTLIFINLFYTIIFVGSLINSQKETSNNELTFLVPLIIINLALFIWFINDYKNDIYYETNDGNFISFFNNNPNKKDFNDFLNLIKKNQQNKINKNLKILN